ncbi:hypothetical protein [Paenibacillus pectinilyticus]|uniref:hypothetical protein n=1 Tax=Paenibacillus pectinilyticus TaxID=512399 RepID=UPI001428BC4F|nr:hypothetical protein [Paenibacillus pectinilyticus]
MSVNSPKFNHISYELDIVKVAKALGIDHERLIAYVYAQSDDAKTQAETEASSSSDPK